MQAAELAVLDWLQAHLRCDFLDAVMPWISRICDHGEIWILLAAVLLLLRKHRWTGMSLSFALILDLICCNIVLKPLVGRVRPFLVNTAVELLTAPPADASFPSGHTAASFAAVFALRASGSPLWKPALVLAAGIAFSRLYLYVHWPTDVLGGILVGAAAGWAGARLADALRRRRELGRRPHGPDGGVRSADAADISSQRRCPPPLPRPVASLPRRCG
ncbi:MAG: phosphatase PAP2 family protein [Oscillibacter sp.]|nr:phosphatase PAP2 family protein [Oscillibacter sp.]